MAGLTSSWDPCSRRTRKLCKGWSTAFTSLRPVPLHCELEESALPLALALSLPLYHSQYAPVELSTLLKLEYDIPVNGKASSLPTAAFLFLNKPCPNKNLEFLSSVADVQY